jgi:class 3 adenylate cyclase
MTGLCAKETAGVDVKRPLAAMHREFQAQSYVGHPLRPRPKQTGIGGRIGPSISARGRWVQIKLYAIGKVDVGWLLGRRTGRSAGIIMDVGNWLRGIGLDQYESVFRENEIDGSVLPDLTEGDFEKLGVPMGHRKRLLKAIATLGATATAVVQPDRPAPQSSTDAAERRQLTVMFCDLVGSTAMSAGLDPEDMRSIIGAYHRCCAALIAGGGGFVAKYMGDGVLAYFGYPQAHEHDAEHAVRAGLAIVEAAPKLDTPAGAPLHVRVGIATGVVVVGDLLGSGEAQERGVVGDTPNLAARLQSIAAPDGVVIGEGTRKLVGDLFELRDLGAQDLKGVAGPTRAYAALSESSRESRFDALHAEGLTALVGREEETDLLLRRWMKAKAGEGQVVLLSGEAGIGKSRLTAEFLQRLSGEPHQRLGIVRQRAAARLAVVASDHEQSVPIFQQLAGGHPSGGDDVREIPALAAQRRRSLGRARDRHQPRDCPVLVEPVWPNVRRGDPQATRRAHARLSAVALALGRGVCEDQRQALLSVAGGRP